MNNSQDIGSNILLLRNMRRGSKEGFAHLKPVLDALYEKVHQRCYIHPDPLEFLYNYDNPADREIAGMIASSLAYGRVAQILKSVSSVLEKMSPSPAVYLKTATHSKLRRDFKGFKHRFTTGNEIADLLYSIKLLLEEYGSLEPCFISGMNKTDVTILPALDNFTARLGSCTESLSPFLIPCPGRGSACKRMNLFLRWMVRADDVDPGGWYNVPASMLVIPLDTHMFNIGSRLGMTSRKQADLKAALEITDAFRSIAPEDPVRYDFSLTRLGIRYEMDIDGFLNECNNMEVCPAT